MFQKNLKVLFLSFSAISLLSACGGGSDSGSSNVDDPVVVVSTELVNGSPVSGCDEPMTELSGAYLEFVAAPNVTAVLSDSGCTITLEGTGKPDHTSAYWDPNGENSDLWVAAENPDEFGNPDRENHTGAASPGFIDDYDNGLSATVSVSPQFADVPSQTHTGSLGIALSGVPIFNEQEGNADLGGGVLRGLDRSGAHTGPQTYHYHLEPIHISHDDDSLVGVIADGFLLYGRKCYSTGDHPVDLDEANGHTSITQHTGSADEDASYHYHITNEAYVENSSYYLLLGSGIFKGIEARVQ